MSAGHVQGGGASKSNVAEHVLSFVKDAVIVHGEPFAVLTKV
jgi:hypothetical protein